MTLVATLISRPTVLTDAHLAIAATVLPRATPRWLAPGIAIDCPFAPEPGHDNAGWTDLLREAFGTLPVDIVLQADTGRRKRLLVADMDSTLIEQECIDELADAVGRRAEVAALTLRSVRGEMEFDEALRERVALLAGLDVAVVSRIVEERITAMPGARTLIATMRANGATTAIVSGGFTLFTAAVAQRLGADRHHANVLEVEGDRLTGTVREPILGRDSKRAILRRLREDLGLAPEAVLAVGDGANDIAMLGAAGLGVAYHAQPAVAAVARARIEHGDLTALLYLQGYAETEFQHPSRPSEGWPERA